MTSESKKLPGDNDFLTGVVEGFYGRPWTYPQRKELFRRMNHMGMNAYLYAPKDDIKHRQSWRDLYTAEEEQELKSLITESTDAGVLFIFAISPGLDVIFSSAKEVEILKKKVDQVSKLGCRAFALLFDDIEPRLCPADREVFTSSARAQVVVANEIYNYLGCPNVFLFCPTEYSASLAVPSISKSEYLSTVASCLAPGITVFWTGPLVVSKNIGATDLRDLSKMLQHPIIIWDNLHANDYDQRRVFIGPYSGRPIALRRDNLVRGVLTNPNCEFEANYVALHTLAQWSRHGALKSPSPMLDKEMTEATGETRGDMYDDAVSDTSNGAEDSQKTTNGPTYRPREALLFALRDWLSLMLQDQQVAHPPSSKSSLTVGTPTPMETDAVETSPTNDAEMQVESQPTSGPSPNATVPEASNGTTSDMNSSVAVTLEDLELFADLFYLPFSHGPAGMRLLELGYWLREHSYARGPNPSDPETSEWLQKFGEFTEMVASITRLRGRIQHLPSRSIAYELAPYISEVHTVLCMLLDYFRWLETGVMANRSMCHLRRLLTWFSPGYKDMVTSGDQEPWTFRGGLITELQRILPLESAQDLFPAPSRAIPGMATVPNLNWTDIPNSAGLAGAPAPFIPYQPPLPTGRLNRTYAYSVRPYRPEDKQNVYALFRRLLLSRVGLPENALPPELADLPGDRYLLHFLEYSPENCFVVEGPPFLYAATHEDTNRKNGSSDKKTPVSCIGFGFSAPNAVACARDRAAHYHNVLRLRYPRIDVPAPSNNTESDLVNPPPSCNASFDNQTQPNKLSSMTPVPGSLVPDECTPIGSLPKSSMSVDELIKFLQLPFHVDVPAVAEIAVAADVVPLPEPLGAALPTQPALSGCLEPTDMDNVSSAAEVMVTPPSIPMDMPPAPSKCVPSSSAPVLPAPLLPDTAPPSPPPTGDVQVPIESCSSSPVVPVTIPSRSVSVAAGPEALHTVLAAHPASVWVEFDDTGVVGCAGLPTASPAPVIPATPVMTNPNLGLNFDPPELIFDSVARRLFICMLAGLKTIGAHGAHVHLDVINEGRADLYRRFGFYPVPAASTEQTTVLARLI